MKQEAQALTEILLTHQETMIEQLHQWSLINSGTKHLQGLDKMRGALHAAFSPIADTIETHALPEISMINTSGASVTERCGDLLFIRKRPHLKRRILLSGHMDTVFDVDHPFQTLRMLDNNTLNGPGVTDMKGGLLVILHALRAFEQSPFAATLGWDVVINADEEIGSPASRLFFDTIASDYQVALVFEPAMTQEGVFAKNRKGSGKLALIATGKSAHAGRAFYEGRNAICYLAEALIAIHALNHQQKKVTLNVGHITGGGALNIVPAHAIANLDVRISQPEDEHWVRKQLHRIIKKLQRPDYTLTLHGEFTRPVKRINPATTRLFHRLKTLGHALGLTLNWTDSGGCCDGNNLAHHGLAVIDTLGVRGGAIHSADEFILLDSLIERSVLSTLLLLDLAKGGLEEVSDARQVIVS